MLVLIKPPADEPERMARMEQVLSVALSGVSFSLIESAEELDEANLQNKKILFAICLTRGQNLEYYRMLSLMRRNRLDGRFAHSTGAVLVDGEGELYTKAIGRELAFTANRAGMTFPGKALVEGTGSLYNFETVGMLLHKNRADSFSYQTKALVEKLLSFSVPESKERNILVVHAGDRTTSNSLMVWDKVCKTVKEKANVREVALRNGKVTDCRGCPFETCRHFGEEGKCFYGGVIVDRIYPAFLEADTLVLICPNYNDAISANMMAFINRLTALFRTNDFSNKRFYAVIVSGYSGSDLVAQQIIGSMCFNKSMMLPPDFALMETANHPGSILGLDGIDVRAASFAERILA